MPLEAAGLDILEAYARRRYDELVGLDWTWRSMAGAMSKAPLGGGKDGAESDGPGQARNDERADYWDEL